MAALAGLTNYPRSPVYEEISGWLQTKPMALAQRYLAGLTNWSSQHIPLRVLYKAKENTRPATGQPYQGRSSASAAMAQRTGGEHRVQIINDRGGAVPIGEAAPEKQLNFFVRSVALIERVGNALGALAFMWATVVLLGGYPTVLRPNLDFWFATAIVFLEAAR